MPDGAPEDCTPTTDAWYSYAIVRAVPRVERDEFVNVGIILFARTLGFLEARLAVDEERLRLLHPGFSLDELKAHLAAFQAVAAGDPAGGPMAAMSQSERFHWLTSPRSTAIQTSPVHVGRCSDPSQAIDDLMRRLVL